MVGISLPINGWWSLFKAKTWMHMVSLDCFDTSGEGGHFTLLEKMYKLSRLILHTIKSLKGEDLWCNLFLQWPLRATHYSNNIFKQYEGVEYICINGMQYIVHRKHSQKNIKSLRDMGYSRKVNRKLVRERLQRYKC